MPDSLHEAIHSELSKRKVNEEIKKETNTLFRQNKK
jgi:hypothetical protein